MSQKCVLCGRPSSKAKFVITGPNGKTICNECVSIISMFDHEANMFEMDELEDLFKEACYRAG